MIFYIKKIKEMHYFLVLESTRGLRISDILKFKIQDCYKKTYNIREQKTGKQKIYEWNPYLFRELKEYIAGKNPKSFLFQSRQEEKQICRQRAYQIIRLACNQCKIYNVRNTYTKKNFWISYLFGHKRCGNVDEYF